MAILGQQDARRSLFNLEGAIERLCTFKCGKEKIKILMSLNYLGV